MSIKKKKSGGGGGANWMDTYGDMVTLLLCFFVLLYAMSTISEENWKALVMSFNPEAVQIQTATPGGDGPSADQDGSGINPVKQPTQQEVDAEIEALYKALSEYVEQEGAQATISVEKNEAEGKIYVSFNQAVFFDGDSPALRQDSFPILDTISGMLSSAKLAIDDIQVLGHTARENPAEPNNVQIDRSLASDRAANVVIYIQQHSEIEPGKLISVGMGEWHPVTSNDTNEGRAQNRRVEMIVSGRNMEQELSGEVSSFEAYT